MAEQERSWSHPRHRRFAALEPTADAYTKPARPSHGNDRPIGHRCYALLRAASRSLPHVVSARNRQLAVTCRIAPESRAGDKPHQEVTQDDNDAYLTNRIILGLSMEHKSARSAHESQVQHECNGRGSGQGVLDRTASTPPAGGPSHMDLSNRI